jgi:uncharacterized protein (TIGR02266 family)
VTVSIATVTVAKHGREALSTALLSLQTSGIDEPSIERAIEHTAAASSALYSAEAASPTEEAAASFIHAAADSLQRAMIEVNAKRVEHHQLEVAATSLARTLALLYPVLQMQLRQRRGRLPVGGLSDSQEYELRKMAAFPRAPSPSGRPPRPSSFEGSERRSAGDKRVFVEVEIGMTSESNFYTGLSLDVSTGGVFVATYEPARTGTFMALYFVLPNGYVVNAEGVVRWTRSASGDAPPGMGVAFTSISQESLAQIGAFCASRAPLYFDD